MELVEPFTSRPEKVHDATITQDGRSWVPPAIGHVFDVGEHFGLWIEDRAAFLAPRTGSYSRLPPLMNIRPSGRLTMPLQNMSNGIGLRRERPGQGIPYRRPPIRFILIIARARHQSTRPSVIRPM